MSTSQMLKALVNKRLTVAAEEIFALFERTIAQYEEELCRSKEENQRKQGLLDSVLGPRVVLLRAGLQTNSVSLGADLNQDITQTLQMMKEEPVPVSIPELHCSAIVRSEESSQTDHTEEAREEEEDISSKPPSQTDTQPEHNYDNDECWGAPLSDAEVESDVADGEQYNQVQIRDKIIAAQNSDAPRMRATVNDRANSRRTKGNGLRKHQCFVCDKRFRSKQHLQTHIRVHTGERPYNCSVCNKRFGDNSTLRGHMRIHTGERPFICSFCDKAFTQSANLHVHVKRMHIGKKTFICSICKKTFARRIQLKVHIEQSHE